MNTMTESWQQFIPFWLQTAPPGPHSWPWPPSTSDPTPPPSPSSPPNVGLLSKFDRPPSQIGILPPAFDRSSGRILASLAPAPEENGGILGSLVPPPGDDAASSPYWLQTVTPFGLGLRLPTPPVQFPSDHQPPSQW